jgi:hypothetical protein
MPHSGCSTSRSGKWIHFEGLVSILCILIAYDIQGIDAEFISLSSIIEGDSNTVLDQPFYDDLAARMAKAIAAAGNKVPVVTGE